MSSDEELPSVSKEQCVVGLITNSSCHSQHFTNKKENLLVLNLSDEKQEIIGWRLAQNLPPSSNICLHHFLFYTEYYESFQKKCCDPNKVHTKIIKASLRPISLQFAKEVKNKRGITLIPGQKICDNCRKKIVSHFDENEQISEDEISLKPLETENADNSVLTPVKQSKLDTTPSKALEKHDLDTSLATLGISPIKVKSLSTGSKVNYAKRKVTELKNKVKSKVARVLKLPQQELESDLIKFIN